MSAKASLALLLLAAVGCGVVETAVDLPGNTVRAITPGAGNKDVPAISLADLQSLQMRFSDSLLRRVAQGVDQLHRPGKAPDRAEVLRWKIALGTEIVSIATGSIALANLLDMTVFVTLSRELIESRWKPGVFGDSTDPLLAAFRDAEEELWRTLASVLAPEQQKEFHMAMVAWQKEHPDPDHTLGARALGFSAFSGAKAATTPDSLFNKLRLDPLAGLDPAMREVAETRAFAERALYVAQKFPLVIRWQTELLAIDALEIPAVRQMIASAGQIAASADRIAGVTEKLPDRFSKEREEIVKALREQEKDIASVLTAGTQMSTSLTTTLAAFDGVMKRLGVGEPKPPGPPGPEAPPFRIQDYTEVAAQLDATARQLTGLLKAMDHTLSTADLARLTEQVTPLVQRAEAGGKDVVDHAFRKLCILVGLVLLAALLYRFLAPRLAPKKP